MTQNIPQGGNIPISASQLTVRVGWSPDRAGGGVDPSAFLLGPGSRVRGDADMVFYNQPRAEGGAVEFSPGDGGTARFSVDLAALPAAVEKIAFALTVHGDRGALGQLSSLWMELSDESTGGGIARFEPETRGRGEAALILGELYRRKGKWKFRAVGQGFEGGLAPLATHFGVDVSGGDDARPEPQPQPSAPPRAPRPDAGAGTRERPREPLSLAVTPEEEGRIDERLGPALAWAEKRLPEAEQLAMDAARLMSCVSDRVNSYRDAGFFKRCWHAISGKKGEVERANQGDLLEMQKHSWRYLKILNERDVLLAHSVMTVKSQLLALADLESETRREVARLAGRIGDRLRGLEGRVAGLEVATEIHSWLLTLDTLDHHRDLPPGLRLLKVVGEFFSIKSDGWNTKEIKYLHKALQEVGLDWREEVTISGFVERLLGEIEAGSIGNFRELASIGAVGGTGPVPHGFVLDSVSVPSLAALSHVALEYDACSEVVDILGGSLRVGRVEAVREVLMGQLARAVPGLGASVSLGDLAVELLNAMRLARALFDRRAEAGIGVDDGVDPQRLLTHDAVEEQTDISEGDEGPPPENDKPGNVPKPGDVWTEPFTSMEFVWVPPGKFLMGDESENTEKRIFYPAKPVHEVELDGFWVGKYPVTQGQWKKLLEKNPAEFKSAGNRRPVERVDIYDIERFINMLNTKENGTFRLPTEAEWEYACRSGGKAGTYAGGNNVDRVAWYSENSDGETHIVGELEPNGLGIYDMCGNVAEIVLDRYDFGLGRSGVIVMLTDSISDSDAYRQHASKNPVYLGDNLPIDTESKEYLNHGGVRILNTGQLRLLALPLPSTPLNYGSTSGNIIRGGSWHGDASDVRCTKRDGTSGLSASSNMVGFRLVAYPNLFVS